MLQIVVRHDISSMEIPMATALNERCKCAFSYSISNKLAISNGEYKESRSKSSYSVSHNHSSSISSLFYASSPGLASRKNIPLKGRCTSSSCDQT